MALDARPKAWIEGSVKPSARKGINRPHSIPDCRTCGACCVGPGFDANYGWADCTEADVQRMSRVTQTKLVAIRQRGWIHNAAIAATPTTVHEGLGKVCDFLRGTPGRRCSCQIYATRPAVCREFEPGSRGCKEARGLLEIGA
jgi:Fe-S-cluster containining protein